MKTRAAAGWQEQQQEGSCYSYAPFLRIFDDDEKRVRGVMSPLEPILKFYPKVRPICLLEILSGGKRYIIGLSFPFHTLLPPGHIIFQDLNLPKRLNGKINYEYCESHRESHMLCVTPTPVYSHNETQLIQLTERGQPVVCNIEWILTFLWLT